MGLGTFWRSPGEVGCQVLRTIKGESGRYVIFIRVRAGTTNRQHWVTFDGRVPPSPNAQKLGGWVEIVLTLVCLDEFLERG